jgi:hypothetical protein
MVMKGDNMIEYSNFIDENDDGYCKDKEKHKNDL